MMNSGRSRRRASGGLHRARRVRIGLGQLVAVMTMSACIELLIELLERHGLALAGIGQRLGVAGACAW